MPQDLVAMAISDATERASVPRKVVEVVSANRVTWPDGSFGCPKPGMLYTQVLVPGYRIVLRAGDLVLNYHSAARGKPVFCPASQLTAPVPEQGNPAH